MTDFDLDAWFEKFWWGYGGQKGRLAHGKKGSKFKAKQAAQAILKKGGPQELERILDNMNALIKFDTQELDKGGQPDRWPHASTFLNQGYFDREIDRGEAEEKRQRSNPKCECGADAVAPIGSTLYCNECFIRTHEDCKRHRINMATSLTSMGIDLKADPQELKRQCKAWIDANAGEFKGILK